LDHSFIFFGSCLDTLVPSSGATPVPSSGATGQADLHRWRRFANFDEIRNRKRKK